MEILGADEIQGFGEETFAASEPRGEVFVHVFG